MFGRSNRAAIAVAAVIFSAGVFAQSPGPPPFTGGIVGQVTNAAGIPQMGATVLLLDSMDRLVTRALSDESGAFLFPSLTPGLYSLRVTMSSFLPAVKRNILVQPGMRSLLSVNLAGALSTVELVYSSSTAGSFMSDDWKWALRSAISTRPVLRLRPAIDLPQPPPGARSAEGTFSDTRAMVRVSGGEEGRVTPYGNEPDLGTAFALATSVFGANQIQVSGNVGYSATTGAPAAGFRTSYSRGARGTEPSAEVNVTMRQLYLPLRAGAALLTGQQGGAPPLRTLEAGFSNRKHLSNDLKVEYGFSIESVSFLNTLNYASPFGRVTYQLEDGESIEAAFSSGAPPPDLLPFSDGPNGALQRDLAALSLFPRVSLRNGRAKVQRTTSMELAYRRTVGSRTFSLAAFQESVNNQAVTMVAPDGSVPPSELLPDLLSNSAVFNAGDYRATGYMISVTQALLEDLNITFAGGAGSALVPLAQTLQSAGHPEELRALLRHGQRRWLAVTATGAVRITGTRYTTSYRWADGRSITAGHFYLTQSLRPDSGWNMYVRQPIPGVPGLRGRLEATADLRNLLAQGYLPFVTLDGRRVLLLHTPRSVRGGVSFIF